jgi:predicted ATPase
MSLRFLHTAVRADNLDEAAILEARKNAEQLLANQKSDLDAAAALAALAETAAQLETIRKIKNRAKFFGTRLFEAKNAHENRSEVHFNSVFMS